MSDPFKDSVVHLTEIVEWTPEMAEELAKIKFDLTPVGWIWSLPPGYADKYPFKKPNEDQ